MVFIIESWSKMNASLKYLSVYYHQLISSKILIVAIGYPLELNKKKQWVYP